MVSWKARPQLWIENEVSLIAVDFSTHSHPGKRQTWGLGVTTGKADFKLEMRRELLFS